jgi:hypothetical protein
MINMILTNLNLFYFTVLQQIPPPPSATAKNGTPPPVGDTVPLDTNVWILLIIAVLMIAYVALPRLKKTA